MSGADVKRRRILALGLCAAAASAVALMIVAPLSMSVTEARDAIAADEDRLGDLRARRVELARLEAELTAARAGAAGSPLFAEAPTSAAAWERLEAILRDLSAKHEAAIVSTHMLRMDEDSGLKAVRAEVELAVPRLALTPLIASLESNAPALFIEKLRLTAGEGREGDDRLRLAGTVRMLAAIVPAAAPGARR